MIQTPRLPHHPRILLPRRRNLLALTLLAGLAACAPGTSLPVLNADRPVAYQLGVGDQILVMT